MRQPLTVMNYKQAAERVLMVKTTVLAEGCLR
jgi:hypothetical protein